MKGVLYIASGNKFVEEAKISAASLKEKSPDLHTTLFTDRKIRFRSFDEVRVIDNPSYSFADKVSHIYESPYEKTLFLDTDTYICSDITELFSLLDHFDMAAAHDHFYKTRKDADVPSSFADTNTGLILFKKSLSVEVFFEKWKMLYDNDAKEGIHFIEGRKAWGVQNQPSFRRALYESDIKITALPYEFNYRLYPRHIYGTVHIIHGRNSNLKSLAEEINAECNERIFIYGLGSLPMFRGLWSAWNMWCRMGFLIMKQSVRKILGRR